MCFAHHHKTGFWGGGPTLQPPHLLDILTIFQYTKGSVLFTSSGFGTLKARKMDALVMVTKEIFEANKHVQVDE